MSKMSYTINEEIEEIMFEDMEKSIDYQDMTTLRFLHDKGWND